ncbi:hypothetical protein [Streptacidiphilus sp. MAP5-3]|uniref:hypothetical protein n=1 Tax=unclassified Streptacidiphilus TaxID=2643834 RepID=UPI0035189FC5
MSGTFSRRSFLRATGIGVAAAAIAPTLAACGAGSTGSTSNVGVKLAPWPTYVPNSTAHYDLPALPNNGAPAALRYPSLPLPSSITTKPGDGSTVTALAVSYGSPVSTGSSNQLLAAVSQALGVTFQPRFVIDSGTTFNQAFAQMEASGDIPDLIQVTPGVPDASQFVEAKCADLTPYLSGDAIKEYPNLASIPTRGWELMGRIDGKIYGVPVYRYNTPNMGLISNKEKLVAAGIWGKGISVDQFAAGMAKLKSAGHYSMGESQPKTFGMGFHAGAAGAPNTWQLQNGKFTHAMESPAYEQALANMRSFYAQGLFNPDAMSLPSSVATQAKFASGEWVTTADSLTGGLLTVFQQVGNSFTVDVAYPYGTAPNVPGGDFAFSYTAIKASSPERIKMLLRVLDYLAAPWGTKEFELVNYGVEGVHFTRAADGSPANPTTLGMTENSSNLPIKYLAQQPQPMFYPGATQDTQRQYDTWSTLLPITVGDPTRPYLSGSATYNAKYATLPPLLGPAVVDIVTGRQPLSSWSSTVAQLKAQCSIDQMAAEFSQAYAAANK